MAKIHSNGVLTTLVIGTIFVSIALSIYNGVVGNFAVQKLHLSAGRYGILTGLRELPGVFSILLVSVAGRVRSMTALCISCVLMSTGIFLSAMVTSFAWLIVWTLLMSVGLHIWYVLRDAEVVRIGAQGQQASILGRVLSFDAIASLTGLGMIWFLVPHVSLGDVLLMAGSLGMASTVWFWFRQRKTQASVRVSNVRAGQRRIIYRRRYQAFYVLQMLSAGREMIVITFATYLLVNIFQTSAQTMALLLVLHHLLAFGTRPIIGKMVDRFGESKSLTVTYGLLTLIIAGYALVREAWVVYVLFIFDYVLSGFDDIALSTYAARLVSDVSELAPTLAMGNTFSHGFAVIFPIVGGFIWSSMGRVTVFLLCAILTFGTMLITACLSMRTMAN